jgi:transposase
MIEADKRKAIFLLSEGGMSMREIARRLGVSRNTVRAVIERKGGAPPIVAKTKILIDPALLQELYDECDGWKQRVHEKLVEEKGIPVKYSTLTRMLRDLGIGPRPAPGRDGSYAGEAGGDSRAPPESRRAAVRRRRRAALVASAGGTRGAHATARRATRSRSRTHAESAAESPG